MLSIAQVVFTRCLYCMGGNKERTVCVCVCVCVCVLVHYLELVAVELFTSIDKQRCFH